MKKVVSFFAMDKTIALNLLGRGWQALAGVITLWVIGLYLTEVEQGFYFTFISVLGLQVFFELGLGYVILQFASHEVAHLTWSKRGLLEGDPLVINRLSSFFRFALIWGLIVSLLIMIIIFPAGNYFFGNLASSFEIDILWQAPWFFICFFSSVIAFINIIFCYLEGCGFVKELAGIRVIQNILASIAMWSLLKFDGGLYSLSLMFTVSAVVGICYLFFYKKEFILNILNISNEGSEKINWAKELWPMQWRIAVSWICGYVVYQMASPVIFAYHGPKAAGQIGMSIAIGLALMSFSMAWIGTKANKFGMLVARRNFIELDKEFFISARASFSLVMVLALIASAVNYLLHVTGSNYADRLLAPTAFFVLMLSTVATFMTYALALYLRAHKEEPLVINSLIGAVISISFLFIFANYFSLNAVVLGYFIVSIMILGLTIKKFIEKKKGWQE